MQNSFSAPIVTSAFSPYCFLLKLDILLPFQNTWLESIGYWEDNSMFSLIIAQIVQLIACMHVKCNSMKFCFRDLKNKKPGGFIYQFCWFPCLVFCNLLSSSLLTSFSRNICLSKQGHPDFPVNHALWNETNMFRTRSYGFLLKLISTKKS